VTDLIILGASGLAREALAVVRETGSHTPIGVLDDAFGQIPPVFSGVPVLGRIANLDDHVRADVLVCVGSGIARERIVQRLVQAGVRGVRFATVVDPSVRNPARCPIGDGSIVLANVSITADVTVGNHVVVMPNSTLTHDDVLENYATLASGVSLGGGVTVSRGAYIGMNAAILPGTRVGTRSVVGMGAAVLDDVPDGETWAGVPARPLAARSRSGSTRPLEMTT
jgi:sugar O-acyltransferase (sialic acid O-acetyltransferase NeuD family)